MTGAGQLFSRTTLGWLIGIGTVAFALSVALAIYAPPVDVTRGANAFSWSAIGHRAFVETLRRAGANVLVSRFATARKVAGGSLVVLAEPDPKYATIANDLLHHAARPAVLLVLPKWRGTRHPSKDHWIGARTLLPATTPATVLDWFDPAGSVLRPGSASGWRGGRVLGAGVAGPELAAPQLVASDHLTPIIAADQGVLLGELKGSNGRVWVLSDPDILSNSGLARPANARLAGGIVDALIGPDRLVVVDEMIHGFADQPSLWRTLFEMPFLVATVIALLAAALMIWAAQARFGAPAPVTPALRAGKGELIANMAHLLQVGRFDRELLQRYREHVWRQVADALHAPRYLDRAATDEWLDRVAKTRGVSPVFGELARDDDPNVLRRAGQLYAWKKAMIDGP